ncbi:MAG: hypothetical protein HQ515_12650 [Phycisphaeraceae bacterium]|nr:hypothetical protein [Phycisphaeraceae bacterium]
MLLTIVLTTLCLGHADAQTNLLHLAPFEETTTTNTPQTLAAVDVCLAPGYCINIKDINDIEVYQSSFNGGNPFTTYYGCGQIDVSTTFPAIIRAAAEATSPAGGTWSVTLDNLPNLSIPTGTTSIAICVLGTEVQAHMLVSTQAQQNVSVAQITLQVMPQ